MSKQIDSVKNQLLNAEAGLSVEKPTHREQGRFAPHPDNTLYTEMGKQAVNKLLALGCSVEEIETMLRDPESTTSIFYEA